MIGLIQSFVLLAAVLVSGLVFGLWLVIVGSSIDNTRLRITLISILAFALTWYVSGR